MPQGLQVWDANGRPVFDLTDRLTRVMGQISSGANDGALYIGDVSAFGAFWCIVIPSVNIFWANVKTPEVRYSGGSLSWTFPFSSVTTVNAPATILYGVY